MSLVSLAQFYLWEPDVEIPVGFGQAEKLWVVVGVCGFSRFTGAWMVPSRAAHDVLAGMLQVLGQFGALPRTAVWDQEGCIGQWRSGRQVLSAEFQAFRGALGMGVHLCAPNDPEAKGIGGAHQRLSRDEFPARPALRGRRRLQPPAHELAAASQRPHPRHDAWAARQGDLRRPRGDVVLPARAARPVTALRDAPAA
jgi:hypothetical protein